MNKFATLATIFAAALTISTGASMAYAPSSGFLSHHNYRSAVIPMGYSLFCLQNPNDCRASGPRTVSAAPSVLATLRQVNLHVNTTMRPRSDGARDTWTLGASAGDCEDYVLNKRAALIRKGVPASALRIAYVKTASGEGHAVLVAMVGRQKLVLDNLTNRIRPLDRSGLTLVSMSTANPMRWQS
jgi:predicted transglutaminase-like cysteine proteinase